MRYKMNIGLWIKKGLDDMIRAVGSDASPYANLRGFKSRQPDFENYKSKEYDTTRICTKMAS